MVDLMFTLKITFKKRWEWNKSAHITFTDLEKAFDRMKQNFGK